MLTLQWEGGARFKQALTSDGYDLRVGLMLDSKTFGWLVYRFEKNERGEIVLWERLDAGFGVAPAMRHAQRQAEVCVANDRIFAQLEHRRATKRIATESRAAARRGRSLRWRSW